MCTHVADNEEAFIDIFWPIAATGTKFLHANLFTNLDNFCQLSLKVPFP